MFLEWLNILSIVIYAEKRFLNLNNGTPLLLETYYYRKPSFSRSQKTISFLIHLLNNLTFDL